MSAATDDDPKPHVHGPNCNHDHDHGHDHHHHHHHHHHAQQPARRVERPGRNEPCWCGSGVKYKKCHLATDNA
ncbi:MAG: SEC-C metal-binding domain-containing protein [Myxococcota bacterium]